MQVSRLSWLPPTSSTATLSPDPPTCPSIHPSTHQSVNLPSTYSSLFMFHSSILPFFLPSFHLPSFSSFVDCVIVTCQMWTQTSRQGRPGIREMSQWTSLGRWRREARKGSSQERAWSGIRSSSLRKPPGPCRTRLGVITLEVGRGHSHLLLCLPVIKNSLGVPEHPQPRGLGNRASTRLPGNELQVVHGAATSHALQGCTKLGTSWGGGEGSTHTQALEGRPLYPWYPTGTFPHSQRERT